MLKKISIVAASAVLFVGLAAGEGCEWGNDKPVENICKNKSETACKADGQCTWKLKDDGSYVCKAA